MANTSPLHMPVLGVFLNFLNTVLHKQGGSPRGGGGGGVLWKYTDGVCRARHIQKGVLVTGTTPKWGGGRRNGHNPEKGGLKNWSCKKTCNKQDLSN